MTADVQYGVVPPIECTSWCEERDGHPEEFTREGQVCWSPGTYVELSLEEVHREESGDFPQGLGVMARRIQQQTVVYLHLRDIKLYGPIPRPYNTLDSQLTMTPDEAERLAAALLGAAILVRSTPPLGT